VTVEWLNEVLSTSDTWTRGRVTSVGLRPIGGSDSLASDVSQLNAKVTTENGQTHQINLLLKLSDPTAEPAYDHFYRAEAHFYNSFGSEAGISIPETYFAKFDDATRRLVVLQEFLSDGQVGTDSVPLGLSDLRRMSSSLAGMHARWWDSEELSKGTGVRTFGSLIERVCGNLLDRNLNQIGRFFAEVGDHVEERFVEYFRTMPEWMPLLLARPPAHQTLIHMDCSAKNAFFPDNPSRPPILFDWAFSHSGSPAYDLAVLFMTSMASEDRSMTRQLVDEHHALLISNGIDGYTSGELWNEFQQGCMWRSYGMVVNAVSGDPARVQHVRELLPRFQDSVAMVGGLEHAGDLVSGGQERDK
jgi:hypothetical protein